MSAIRSEGGGSAEVGAAGSTSGAAAEGEDAAIPIVVEEAHVSKREVVTARVRVRTVVDEIEEIVRDELDVESVEVTRVPIDRYVDAAPAVRTEGEVTIVPVLEEVLVVETKLLLKEEVHVRRTRTKEAVEQPVLLRKQRAVVEEIDER